MKNHLRDIAVFLGIVVLFVLGFYVARQPDLPAQVVSAGYIIATSTDVELSIGQTGRVGQLEITLNDLLQDSRCPVDAQCIQAGSVTASVTLNRMGQTLATTMSSSGAAQQWSGYSVSLVQVEPERTSNAAIDPTQYELTFRAVKQ